MSLHIIILAAGLGKRMYSAKPKVLHELGGKPLLAHVITTALSLKPTAIHIIYGHGGEQTRDSLTHFTANASVNWIYQAEQLGTGHAVMQALPHIPPNTQVLVLYGDVPLIQANTLANLIACAQQSHALTLLLAHLPDPHGLGRIVRDQHGNIRSIVEEKDATEAQRKINEIYSGICCVASNNLNRWLPQLDNHNAQEEYYLTEIIQMAVHEQQTIQSIDTPHLYEIQGVNNRLQLNQLERVWQKMRAQTLLLAGVTLADASRIDIRGELEAEQDVFIDINCVFIGKVTLEEGCHIGPNCVLSNATIGKNSHILPNSVLDGCYIGSECHVGPFARLRPGTHLSDACKIGNFVETKNAVFGEHSKASHLSYLGDVTIGSQVNIGAGTITCNYDGVNKHQTIIEDGAFIGSDTQLVAPVTVGANSTIGAGSTIRADVPADELTLTVSKQKTIYGWKRPVKKTVTEK